MKLSRTHITLVRVLVLTLGPSVTSVAISVYNTVEISHDRAHRRAQIDQEICAVVARLPGDVRKFETDLRCPITTPIRPTPTKITTTPTPPATTAPVRVHPVKPNVATPTTPAVIEATQPGVTARTGAPSPTSTSPAPCMGLFRKLTLC